MEKIPRQKTKASRAIEAAVVVMIIGILAALIFPVFAGDGGQPATTCLNNLKQQGLGLLMYASDHDDRLPLAEWIDLIGPYTKNESFFHEPLVSKEHKSYYGYAFNSSLFGVNTTKLKDPVSTPMNYESTSTARNSADPFASLPKPGRHNDANNVAYADGHAKRLKQGAR